MVKKIFKVLGILVVVLIGLVVVIAKWSNSTTGAMTEPIRQEFAVRTSDTFRISKPVFGETEGTAIVAITDKDGQTHEEKYFLKKTNDVWTIDKKEPYIAPTSTPVDTPKNSKDKEVSTENTNITAVTVVDGSEVEAKKDGDIFVITERDRYFARVTLAQPITKTTSFKHSYKKTSSGFVRGFKTEVLFVKDPPITVLYIELKPNDGSFSVGTYESTINIGDSSTILKYRVE